MNNIIILLFGILILNISAGRTANIITGIVLIVVWALIATGTIHVS